MQMDTGVSQLPDDKDTDDTQSTGLLAI